jgi:hypothetical protein
MPHYEHDVLTFYDKSLASSVGPDNEMATREWDLLYNMTRDTRFLEDSDAETNDYIAMESDSD